MISRRTFLGSLAAGAAGARLAAPLAAQERARLPLAFSTLGSPDWEWTRVLDFAAEHGFSALELRGLQRTMDLTRRPEFAPARLDATREQLRRRGLRVVTLGSSANLHPLDDAQRDPQLREAASFIDLAQSLGAPYVRVFGDRWVEGVPRERVLDRVADGLRRLGEHARGKGVTVLLEAHGDFADGPVLLDLMRRADHPHVALLWDAHHTFVAGEAPAETYRQLRPYVRHVHLKDSLPGEKERRYVITGQGNVPVAEQVRVLRDGGYRGYYSFEWEKLWHPEIEAPEVAIAHYARLMKGLLGGDAG